MENAKHWQAVNDALKTGRWMTCDVHNEHYIPLMKAMHKAAYRINQDRLSDKIIRDIESKYDRAQGMQAAAELLGIKEV